MDNKERQKGGHHPMQTEDLIGAGQPVIVKESGDKKLIYILLILIVILFIVALAVIGYMSTNYMKGNQPSTAVQSTSTKTVSEIAQKTPAPAAAPTPKEEKQQQSAMQQSVAKAAAASGAKNLKQEELAKIVQMVMAQMAKQQAQQQEKKTKTKESTAEPVTSQNEKKEKSAGTAVTPEEAAAAPEDKQLIESLSNAEVDTLEADKETTPVPAPDAGKNKAKTGKAADTYNKVVVVSGPNEGKDDDLSQLTNEINSVLAETEENEKAPESSPTVKFEKEINAETKERQNEMRFIVVKPGDTLSSIAQRAYGSASMYVKIYRANPDLVKNPNRIFVGMRLRVPQ